MNPPIDIGDSSVAKSAVVFDRSANSKSDQNLDSLRKAIVDDLIKNPKTFKGNRNDVNKWIEKIRRLLHLAYISDAIRLDLVPYLSPEDALEWFKNNRSVFTS